MYLCFTDYEKAFDNVKHDQLLKYLQNVNADEKYLKIIGNLYWHHLTEDINIKKKVRQGTVLSPTFFNLYVEWIFSEALQDLEISIKVNDRIVNNIRYADDTVLLAGNPQDPQTILHVVNAKGREADLRINVEKTKMIVVCKEPEPFTLQVGDKIITKECHYSNTLAP